jgi:hypothetical protein
VADGSWISIVLTVTAYKYLQNRFQYREEGKTRERIAFKSRWMIAVDRKNNFTPYDISFASVKYRNKKLGIMEYLSREGGFLQKN